MTDNFTVPYQYPDVNDDLFTKDIVNGTFFKVMSNTIKSGQPLDARYTSPQFMEMSNQLMHGGKIPMDVRAIDHNITVYDRNKLLELASLPIYQDIKIVDYEVLTLSFAPSLLSFDSILDDNFKSVGYDYKTDGIVCHTTNEDDECVLVGYKKGKEVSSLNLGEVWVDDFIYSNSETFIVLYCRRDNEDNHTEIIKTDGSTIYVSDEKWFNGFCIDEKLVLYRGNKYLTLELDGTELATGSTDTSSNISIWQETIDKMAIRMYEDHFLVFDEDKVSIKVTTSEGEKYNKAEQLRKNASYISRWDYHTARGHPMNYTLMAKGKINPFVRYGDLPISARIEGNSSLFFISIIPDTGRLFYSYNYKNVIDTGINVKGTYKIIIAGDAMYFVTSSEVYVVLFSGDFVNTNTTEDEYVIMAKTLAMQK